MKMNSLIKIPIKTLYRFNQLINNQMMNRNLNKRNKKRIEVIYRFQIDLKIQSVKTKTQRLKVQNMDWMSLRLELSY